MTYTFTTGVRMFHWGNVQGPYCMAQNSLRTAFEAQGFTAGLGAPDSIGFTNGSPNYTLANTSLQTGDLFIFIDGSLAVVATFSNGSGTLTENFTGTTGNHVVMPFRPPTGVTTPVFSPPAATVIG